MRPTLRDGVAWAALGAMAVTAAAPWASRVRGRPVTAMRSLMPWSALSAGPLAVGALLTGRRRLALASSGVAVAAVAMSIPLVVPRRQPEVEPGSLPLRVTHTNLLYINRRVAAIPAVLGRVDADVLTFSELTPTHLRRLHASDLVDRYPHRVELTARGGSGTGLWSRYPVTELHASGTNHHIVVADVDVPVRPIRVIVIHTQSPIIHYRQWIDDLDALGELAPDVPTLMTGDFNAAWWHPELRQLMRRRGWRDAHQLTGHGLSCSWPTEKWHPVFKVHPPFVRLDHALVNDGLTVLGTRDVDTPGSDHRTLVVTVQRARRATP